MPVRFLQMQSRDARAALIGPLLLVSLCAAPTAAARWSAPARPAGCSTALPAAAAPSIVFPSSEPTSRSGPGALLWSAPRGCVVGAAASEAVGATLAGDDFPGRGRALTAGAGNLAEVLAATGTATGQVLAVGAGNVPTPVSRHTPTDGASGFGALVEGSTVGAFAEGRTVGAFAPAQPLAGPVASVAGTVASAVGPVASVAGPVASVAGPVASAVGPVASIAGPVAPTVGPVASIAGPAAPVAVSSSYLGDVAIASPAHTRAGWAIAVRVQRHYSEAPGPERLVPAGPGPLTAVAATMDYRAELLLVWASDGEVYARVVSPSGAAQPAQRLGSIEAGSSVLELCALLSDDGHAIVAWRRQSLAPGGAQSTTIESNISGSELTFGAPRPLERFRDLGGFVPPAGSLRLLRLSSEAVMIAWTGVDEGRYVVRASPVSLRRGVWAPVAISGDGATGVQAGANRSPATDAVLADLAAGPDAEAFALWRVAPRLPSGAPNPRRWAIRASRGHYAGRGEVSFGAPEIVAPAGPNGPPAGAVDPATGRALAAWVALVGTPHVEYALHTQISLPVAAIPATALGPTALGLTALGLTALASTGIPPTAIPPTALGLTALASTGIPPTALASTAIPPTALACCLGLPYASIDSSAIRIGTPLAACLK
jgi:hypothetical protein